MLGKRLRDFSLDSSAMFELDCQEDATLNPMNVARVARSL